MKNLSSPIVIASAIIGICAIIASFVSAQNGRYQIIKDSNGMLSNGVVFDTHSGKMYPIYGELFFDVVNEKRRPRKK